MSQPYLTVLRSIGLLFSTAFGGNTTTNGTAGGQQYQQVIQMSPFLALYYESRMCPY